MMMLPIVFQLLQLWKKHGAQKLRKFDYIAWGGIWMLYWRNCYISGTSNLSLSIFEIIYPNAPEFLFWCDLCAAIKFNNVCRNFSCSLYYVSTKDFEVLDKSF
jgi:hypothetical protein